MNTICLKCKWLVAIIILVITLAIVAGGCSVNGRYQMTCIQGENPKVFVIDTQTGEVKGLDFKGARAPYGYIHDTDQLLTSGPWPKK